MTIAIHQPNFIPWLGYFYKMMNCDVFIILDDVQYTKNSFINRNRIKTSNGELWLTIPIVVSGKYGQLINECVIQKKEVYISKVLKTVELNYKKSKYFVYYFNSFERLINEADDNLSNINISLIKWVASELDIQCKIELSSKLKVQETSTDRLIQLCKCFNGDHYLAGFGGKKYQEEQLFNEANVKLVTTNFTHPTYHQLWGDFMNNMSIVDLLFNEGPYSKQILHEAHQ